MIREAFINDEEMQKILKWKVLVNYIYLKIYIEKNMSWNMKPELCLDRLNDDVRLLQRNGTELEKKLNLSSK